MTTIDYRNTQCTMYPNRLFINEDCLFLLFYYWQYKYRILVRFYYSQYTYRILMRFYYSQYTYHILVRFYYWQYTYRILVRFYYWQYKYRILVRFYYWQSKYCILVRFYYWQYKYRILVRFSGVNAVVRVLFIPSSGLSPGECPKGCTACKTCNNNKNTNIVCVNNGLL